MVDQLDIITAFFAVPEYRTIAVQCHRALLAWQADLDDRKLRKAFKKAFARLPVEF